MRILLLSDEFPPDGTGGDGMVVSCLARGYRKSGHDVFIAAATPIAARAGRDVWEEIPIERIYADYHPRWQAWLSLWNPPAVRRVQKIIAEFKPSIVHAHGVNRYLSYRTLVVAHNSGARVFLTAHDAMLYHYGKAFDELGVSAWQLFKLYKQAYNPLRNFMIRQALNHIEGVIAVSESLARALRANAIPVVAIIYNGIDINAWKIEEKKVSHFKVRHGLGDHVVLFGGRISGLKGAFAIIEAFEKVVQQIPDAQLCVIGTRNTISEKMLESAKDRGIERAIIFTGRITDDYLRAAFHAAAVVTVPSLYLEPFGMMVLEAMACSRAVIGSNKGGIPEIIIDKETGFVVDTGDAIVFAKKLILLLRDPILRDAMGRAGEERANRDFSLDSQVKAYERLFQ